MVDSLKVVVYSFIGLSVFGFLAGVSDGMNGGDSILTGSIMWVGLIGLGVTSIIRYRRNKQLRKEEQRTTPI